MIENIENITEVSELLKYPITKTDTVVQYGYEEKTLNIPDGFVDFLIKKGKELEIDHTEKGYFCAIDSNGYEREYCPCVHFRYYNMFHFYHPFIFEIHKTIREMTKQYCDKNNIDFDKQNYLLHGFYSTASRYRGLDWHDHGHEENHLHGFMVIDAEPSETYYYINNEIVSVTTKNGRIIVGKNQMHARGGWNQNKPRIVIAFNIKPVLETNPEEHYILL